MSSPGRLDPSLLLVLCGCAFCGFAPADDRTRDEEDDEGSGDSEDPGSEGEETHEVDTEDRTANPAAQERADNTEEQSTGLLVVGGSVQALQFLLWIGAIVLIVAIIAWLVRTLSGRRSV